MAGTLLRRVRLLDPLSQTDQITDVLMVDGVFQAISPELPEPSADVAILDATGKILAPGLVDLYSHSSEPGHESRESLADLMTGAIAGGFTRLGILPDTLPPLDSPGAIRHLLDLAGASSLALSPDLLPWAALTQGVEGQQMAELVELSQLRSLPIAGLGDGHPLHNPMLLQRLLEYVKPLNCPLALWPSEPALVGDGVARAGSLALMGGLPGSPVAAETAALATLLELVREIGTPVHLMRISTARSVEIIAQAKAEGLPITASTPWMNLLFSTKDVLSYDPNLRLEPPLGNSVDQEALIEGVKAGTVDAIAIDHSPYTYEEKTVPFQAAPPGVIGLEFAFSALWQHFVSSSTWTALELVQAMTLRPAMCLGLSPGHIAVGNPTEALLFDPNMSWTVNRSTLRSPALNTPFLNQVLRGKVIKVWRN